MKKRFPSNIYVYISLIFVFSWFLLTSCSSLNYTLVFHTNSEDNISNISKTKAELESYTLAEPKKEGYTFDGWYFDNAYEHPYSYESLSNDKILIELYAKYTINEYKIIVHSTENVEYKFKYGDTIELAPLVNDEHNCVGYFTDEALTKEFKLQTMPANNIDLYPKFDEVYYTLVFHTNSEGIIANISKTKEELKSYTLAESEKEGYIFEGWYFDNAYEHPYNYESLSKDETLIELYAKYHETTYSYEVTVNLNIPNSATLSGGNIKQRITNDNQFDCIEIEPNYGYKYLYYEIDGIKYSGSNIQIEKVNQDIIVDVICEYATYELPIINIDTNNTPILNKIDYVKMNFSIENCADELSNISGGIRFRGNSTMGYLKKPYRLKFDKKQSLFGLEKSKSWVLLADFLDPSCLHNYAALTLGNDLDGLAFTPTPNKVNVYMNGEYIGLYTLAEQVQEGKGRVDIEKTITEDMVNLKDFNFLIALDASVTGDADAVLDETYFILNTPGQDMVFELKYPEKADFVSEEQFNNFFAELKNYISSLVDSFIDNDYSALNNEVNLNSLVDYLIIDEILMEHDHYYKSFNMYFTSTSSDLSENNKLNFGPIWDYDWSLDTPWTGKPNDYYLISNDIFYSNVFFGACNNVSEIKQLLKDRYTQNMSSKLGLFIDELMIYEDSIKTSLELNANKWYTEGYKITLDNIIFLNKHLLNRKLILDNEWLV